MLYFQHKNTTPIKKLLLMFVFAKKQRRQSDNDLKGTHDDKQHDKKDQRH